MKLFTHYNRINLLTTIAVLFVTGILYYGAISYILNHQVDKDLRTEETETLNYIKEHRALPEPVDDRDQKVSYTEVKISAKRTFINMPFFNKREHENESGRALITLATVKGHIYQITIAESKVETEDLIRIVFCITIGVIMFLLLILFITNRFILNRLWKPFYNVLLNLRTFNLRDGRDITYQASNIDEFEELNMEVTQMSTRVKTDYRELKVFTENASHELLTPLAVLNSKLDSLIQTGDYNEHQSKLLDDVYSAVSRLTRLNQSLLLLVKIENKLLQDEQLIDLKPLIEDKLSEFKELFLDKQLRFTCILVNKQIIGSTYLIDILLNNLLSNAMRHNYVNGEIRIFLTANELKIQNTCTTEPLVVNDVFKRFNKSSGSEGTGLGLTISKQICDNYNYKLNYSYDENYHTFRLTLS